MQRARGGGARFANHATAVQGASGVETPNEALSAFGTFTRSLSSCHPIFFIPTCFCLPMHSFLYFICLSVGVDGMWLPSIYDSGHQLPPVPHQPPLIQPHYIQHKTSVIHHDSDMLAHIYPGPTVVPDIQVEERWPSVFQASSVMEEQRQQPVGLGGSLQSTAATVQPIGSAPFNNAKEEAEFQTFLTLLLADDGIETTDESLKSGTMTVDSRRPFQCRFVSSRHERCEKRFVNAHLRQFHEYHVHHVYHQDVQDNQRIQESPDGSLHVLDASKVQLAIKSPVLASSPDMSPLSVWAPPTPDQEHSDVHRNSKIDLKVQCRYVDPMGKRCMFGGTPAERARHEHHVHRVPVLEMPFHLIHRRMDGRLVLLNGGTYAGS